MYTGYTVCTFSNYLSSLKYILTVLPFDRKELSSYAIEYEMKAPLLLFCAIILLVKPSVSSATILQRIIDKACDCKRNGKSDGECMWIIKFATLLEQSNNKYTNELNTECIITEKTDDCNKKSYSMKTSIEQLKGKEVFIKDIFDKNDILEKMNCIRKIRTRCAQISEESKKLECAVTNMLIDSFGQCIYDTFKGSLGTCQKYSYVRSTDGFPASKSIKETCSIRMSNNKDEAAICDKMKEAKKMSIEAAALSTNNLERETVLKRVTAKFKAVGAVAKAAAATMELFPDSLLGLPDLGGALSTGTDAELLAVESNTEFLEADIMDDILKGMHIENAGNKLMWEADIHDECYRPSTKELQCMLHGVDKKLDSMNSETSSRLSGIDANLTSIDTKLFSAITVMENQYISVISNLGRIEDKTARLEIKGVPCFL